MNLQREIAFSDVPALGFACSAIIGVAIALFLPIGVSLAFIVSTCLTIVALIALLFFRWRTIAAVLTFTAICAIVSFRGTSDIARDVRESLVQHDPDTAIVTCRGVVIWRDAARQTARSERLWLENVELRLADSVIQADPLRVRLSVPIAEATNIRIGDVIACDVRLESAHLIQHRSVRELCWSLRERLIANARLVNRESLVIVKGSTSAREVVFLTRKSVLNTLEGHLKPDARAVAGALLLGSREAFSSEFREDLQLTGLAHLFALSGLNTGLLVSLCWLIMAWLRVPRKIRYALLLIFLVFYTAIGLGVPSMFRSATMAGLMIVSRLIARPSHPINLLLFSAGLELLIWPLHVLDAGFHLSYLSMAGILTAYAVLKKPMQDLLVSKSQNIAHRTADTLSSTIGAQLATAPAASMLFGRVPGLAIIANIVAIPLFSLLVVLILFLLLLDPLSFGAASAVARAIEGLVGVFALITSSAASVVGASVSASVPIYLSAIAVIFQLIAIVLCLRGRVWQSVVVTLVVMNVLIWPSHLHQKEDGRIAIIGKSEAGTMYLRAGEMICMIGCGPEWLAERTSSHLADLMAEDGIENVGILIIDSRLASKIGGAANIIAAANPMLVVDLSEQRHTHASAILDAEVLNTNLESVRGEAGMSWSVGDSRLQIKSSQEVDGYTDWRILLSDCHGNSIEVQSENGQVSERLRVESPSFDDGRAFVALPFAQNGCSEWKCRESEWNKSQSSTDQLMSLWNLPGRASI